MFLFQPLMLVLPTEEFLDIPLWNEEKTLCHWVPPQEDKEEFATMTLEEKLRFKRKFIRSKYPLTAEITKGMLYTTTPQNRVVSLRGIPLKITQHYEINGLKKNQPKKTIKNPQVAADILSQMEETARDLNLPRKNKKFVISKPNPDDETDRESSRSNEQSDEELTQEDKDFLDDSELLDEFPAEEEPLYANELLDVGKNDKKKKSEPTLKELTIKLTRVDAPKPVTPSDRDDEEMNDGFDVLLASIPESTIPVATLADTDKVTDKATDKKTVEETGLDKCNAILDCSVWGRTVSKIRLPEGQISTMPLFVSYFPYNWVKFTPSKPDTKKYPIHAITPLKLVQDAKFLKGLNIKAYIGNLKMAIINPKTTCEINKRKVILFRTDGMFPNRPFELYDAEIHFLIQELCKSMHVLKHSENNEIYEEDISRIDSEIVKLGDKKKDLQLKLTQAHSQKRMHRWDIEIEIIEEQCSALAKAKNQVIIQKANNAQVVDFNDEKSPVISLLDESVFVRIQ